MKAIWTEGSNGRKVVVVGITSDDFHRMIEGGAPVAPAPDCNYDVVVVARESEDGLMDWMETAGCAALGCGLPDPHLN